MNYLKKWICLTFTTKGCWKHVKWQWFKSTASFLSLLACRKWVWFQLAENCRTGVSWWWTRRVSRGDDTQLNHNCIQRERIGISGHLNNSLLSSSQDWSHNSFALPSRKFLKREILSWIWSWFSWVDSVNKQSWEVFNDFLRQFYIYGL